MDTSETYIKMCEKAEEIQSLWEGKTGDFYVYRYKNNKMSHIRLNPYVKGTKPKQGIWLPRQDQLQEMVKSPTALALAWGFHRWLARTEPDEHEDALYDPSMEQLWLAFVMKEKFNKTWNGEDWIQEVIHD